MSSDDVKIFNSGDRVYGDIFVPENIISIKEEFDDESKILKCRIYTKEKEVFTHKLSGFTNDGKLICSSRDLLREMLLSGIIFYYNQKISFNG